MVTILRDSLQKSLGHFHGRLKSLLIRPQIKSNTTNSVYLDACIFIEPNPPELVAPPADSVRLFPTTVYAQVSCCVVEANLRTSVVGVLVYIAVSVKTVIVAISILILNVLWVKFTVPPARGLSTV